MASESDVATIEPSPKRGRGRPKGSRNKPKPPVSPEERVAIEREREAVKNDLSRRYREAVVARALAETQARGLKSMIRNRLGYVGLAEIQAEIIREQAQAEASLEHMSYADIQQLNEDRNVAA